MLAASLQLTAPHESGRWCRILFSSGRNPQLFFKSACGPSGLLVHDFYSNEEAGELVDDLQLPRVAGAL